MICLLMFTCLSDCSPLRPCARPSTAPEESCLLAPFVRGPNTVPSQEKWAPERLDACVLPSPDLRPSSGPTLKLYFRSLPRPAPLLGQASARRMMSSCPSYDEPVPIKTGAVAEVPHLVVTRKCLAGLRWENDVV